MNAANDWFARPAPAFLAWCLPLAVGFASLIFAPPRSSAIIWAVCFLWMGTACVINARNCNRLHCYISAPVFFIGAAVMILLAAGLVSLGAHGPINTVSVTLLLALMSFLPELIWRKYI